MTEFCQLILTCANQVEAGKITKALLGKKLIACARQFPVTSTFKWQGKIEDTDEVMLIMESRMDLFAQIEAEVTKLHSYDTFTLEALPVEKISPKAAMWLQKELKI